MFSLHKHKEFEWNTFKTKRERDVVMMTLAIQ